MKNNVFVLRADFGRYTNTFEKEGYIGIGWFEVYPKGWDLTCKSSAKSGPIEVIS